MTSTWVSDGAKSVVLGIYRVDSSMLKQQQQQQQTNNETCTDGALLNELANLKSWPVAQLSVPEFSLPIIY